LSGFREIEQEGRGTEKGRAESRTLVRNTGLEIRSKMEMGIAEVEGGWGALGTAKKDYQGMRTRE
jgi:hypothetical protein